MASEKLSESAVTKRLFYGSRCEDCVRNIARYLSAIRGESECVSPRATAPFDSDYSGVDGASSFSFAGKFGSAMGMDTANCLGS